MRRARISLVSSLVLLGLILSFSSAQAQTQTPSEEPQVPEVPEVKISRAVIGGGGPTAGMLFLDLVGLNQKLEANGYKPFDDMLFMMGGGGFGGELESFRFGGIGFGGEAYTSTITKEVQKTAKLSLGFGGFLIEKGLFAEDRYSLAAGAVIGGGGADLTLLDHQSDSFDEAINNPPNLFLTRGFFGVETYAGLEFALLDWIMLKVNVGYLWAFGEPWKQDKIPIPGPPKNLSSYLVQFMIAFGGRTAIEEGSEPEIQK